MSELALYHRWSVPQAQRVRLALGAKGLAWDDRPLSWHDDETFFELGVARQVPVLVVAGAVYQDSLQILARLDALFPGEPALAGWIDPGAWQALVDWRQRVDAVLARLYAPVAPACADLAGDDEALAAFKRDTEHRFGLGLEALANDRYDGFAQLVRLSHLPQLAKHLAAQRFYLGRLSVADCLLAADLFPLEVHDGLSLPVDLMYYLERVQQACDVDLRAGLVLR